MIRGHLVGLTELLEMEITQMRSRSEMTRVINSAVLRVSCLKKKNHHSFVTFLSHRVSKHADGGSDCWKDSISMSHI